MRAVKLLLPVMLAVFVIGVGSIQAAGSSSAISQQQPLTPFVLPTPDADGNMWYVVQPGDTLWRIAGIAGLTVDELKAMNGLTSDVISTGQRLIIGQATPTAPTAAPTSTLDPNAPTAPPAGAPTATPQPAGMGTVCALLFEDTNGNGRRDESELPLGGGQLAVLDAGTGQPVQAYSTTGAEAKPYCFENLAAGPYTVSAAPPAGYNSTNASATTLEVAVGSLSNMEFGAQPGATAGQNTAPASGSDRRLRTALFGAAGIMFLLLAAGVAGFLILRRR
jgi:LysM repeat protein